MSFDTLILAAGRSSRMGQPKALLRYNDQTFLEQIVHRAGQTTPGEVVLVCGHPDAGATLPREAALELTFPILPSLTIVQGKSNAHPIDSIRCGLGVLPAPNRLLLWPVDMVFGSAELIATLASSFQADEDKIARPIHDGKHGHPVLFGHQARHELTTVLADEGAHHVVHHKPARMIDIACNDQRITQALNTPQQARLCGVNL